MKPNNHAEFVGGDLGDYDVFRIENIDNLDTSIQKELLGSLPEKEDCIEEDEILPFG